MKPKISAAKPSRFCPGITPESRDFMCKSRQKNLDNKKGS
jgi:hypothetical protein